MSLFFCLLLSGFARAEDPNLLLRFEGDDRLAKPIEVLAWSWGASHDGAKASVQDLSLTLYVGPESPALMQLVSSGKKLKGATMSVAGTDTSKRQKFSLKNVRATSFSIGGSGSESKFTENVTLEFDKVEFTYEEDVEGKTESRTESISSKP